MQPNEQSKMNRMVCKRAAPLVWSSLALVVYDCMLCPSCVLCATARKCSIATSDHFFCTCYRHVITVLSDNR